MILHQDDVIVVVNKPAGMPVHRSRLVSDGDAYLIDVVRAQLPGRLHLIHRLDRATSGVLLIGRIVGSYLHGMFTSDAFRAAYLSRLGVEATPRSHAATLESALEALADHVEAHLDVAGLLACAR